MSASAESPTFGVSAWVREMRRSWWAVLVIASGLTLLLLDFDHPSARRLAVGGAYNLVITTCIASTIVGLQTMVIARFDLPRAWWVWLIHAASVGGGLVLGTELAIAVLGVWDDFDPRRLRGTVWKIGAVISVSVTVFGVAYDRLRTHAVATELVAERAQQELLKARLENLQARLNPHFLFNSLNTVAALIEDAPDKAVVAVEQLSELLRYGLEGTRRPVVPLSRELDAVEAFVRIEQLRFGERLSWTTEVDPAALEVPVPPLLLQPLIENAVKHEIATRRQGGAVRLAVHIQESRLVVVVEDDGPGLSAAEGTATGEATVRERLALAYGDAASFVTGPGPGGGYRVRLEIPLEDASA